MVHIVNPWGIKTSEELKQIIETAIHYASENGISSKAIDDVLVELIDDTVEVFSELKHKIPIID